MADGLVDGGNRARDRFDERCHGCRVVGQGALAEVSVVGIEVGEGVPAPSRPNSTDRGLPRRNLPAAEPSFPVLGGNPAGVHSLPW